MKMNFANTSKLPLFLLFLPIVLLLVQPTLVAQDSAADKVVHAAPQDAETKTKATIENILTLQAKAWNDGDLEKFMETYWKSDKLSFSSGGKTTYGWQGTLDNYRKGYAPPKQMGQLHFDKLGITMIESNSALVLGHWHLKMKNAENRDGNFSLVIKKLDSGWKIIHDHSSELEKKEEVPKTETSNQ